MMTNADHNWTSGLVPMIEPHQLADILAQVSDLALFITPMGEVTGAMSNPSFMPKTDFSTWVGQNLSEQLTVESIPKFKNRLGDLAGQASKTNAVELNHITSTSHAEFPMRYSFHQVDGGKSILMLGRDLRPVAEMQQQLVAAQIALEKDYEAQREYEAILQDQPTHLGALLNMALLHQEARQDYAGACGYYIQYLDNVAARNEIRC